MPRVINYIKPYVNFAHLKPCGKIISARSKVFCQNRPRGSLLSSKSSPNDNAKYVVICFVVNVNGLDNAFDEHLAGVYFGVIHAIGSWACKASKRQ